MTPLYAKESEVAEMLSRSLGWLKKNAAELEETTGFPKVDPAIGLRHTEAIKVWARRRNIRQEIELPGQKLGAENLDEF